MRPHIFLMACGGLLLACQTAASQVKITNLSGKSVQVARYKFVPETHGGDLKFIVPAHYVFRGWRTVDPGETYRSKYTHFHVAREGGTVNWSSAEKTPGIIRSQKFRREIGKATTKRDIAQAKREGYEVVEFQRLQGLKVISGGTYRITSKIIPFNFSSRSVNFHSKQFNVPGRVVDYDVEFRSWGAKGVSWKYAKNKRSVVFSCSTEGAQKRPFGPREPGYYRGRVKIRYTIPN